MLVQSEMHICYCVLTPVRIDGRPRYIRNERPRISQEYCARQPRTGAWVVLFGIQELKYLCLDSLFWDNTLQYSPWRNKKAGGCYTEGD